MSDTDAGTGGGTVVTNQPGMTDPSVERIAYQHPLGLGPQDIPLPPAPVPPPWTDPVFYTTTVIPIVLAVVAAVFHKDLTQYATQFASLAAAIATIAYGIYSGARHAAHAHAVAAYYQMKTSLLFMGVPASRFD